MDSRRAGLALWMALAALQLAPVWAMRWIPTQDGPSHLENANILLQLNRSGPPAFAEYFAVNPRPTPNWLGHAALSGLIRVFGPLPAEKILLSLYLIGLPLAVRYAFVAIRPDSAPLAVLAFPLLYNCLLHYGFYNFCLSLALFFFVLGWRLRRGSGVVLSLALLLLYGCHVVSWVLALAALAFFAPRRWRGLAAAAAPSAAIALWFFALRPAALTGAPAVSFSARWNGLWHFSPAVFSYADLHQWAGGALALLLAGTAASRMRRLPVAPLAFSGAVLLLYFSAPPQAFGGMALLERLNLYFFLSLLLWAPYAPPGTAGQRRLLQGAAAAFTLLLLALNLPWYRAVNRLTDDLLSAAPHLRPGAVFLPLIYDPRGPAPLRDLYGEPLRHSAGYAAVLRNAINLDNYEAQTDLFPVVFRTDHNPGVFVGAMEENPPRVRLDSHRIQSLLVWDPNRTAPPPPPDFTLVFTSPAGHARLYRRP